MAPQTAARMTVEEFLSLPDDGQRYELIDGELILNPSPLLKHQRIVRVFLHQLDAYFAEHGGGEVLCAPVDVVLGGNVVEPDLIVIKSDRAAIAGVKNVSGGPNLVIEVLSDGTRRRDEVVKRKLYEEGGVDEYWIADPELDLVRIYRRAGRVFQSAGEINTEAGGTITSPLFPGFALDIRDVFIHGMP